MCQSFPTIDRAIDRAFCFDGKIIATFGPSEEVAIMALVTLDDDKGVADYLYHSQAFDEMCSEPFDGIEDLMQALNEKGIRMAMVTAKGKHSTAISLDQFRFDKYRDSDNILAFHRDSISKAFSENIVK